MKKVVSIILIVICCALLTGCGEVAGKSAGESGDFYVEFMATDAPEDGWYQITAEAHVEDSLPLVYLQAQAETEIDMEFTLTGNKGLFWLVYVQADGTEQELLSVAGRERALPAVWNCSLPLGTESGHLEFRTSQSAELQFELVLSNMDGVDINLSGVFEKGLTPIEELSPITEENQKSGGVTFSGEPNADSVGMKNFHKALNAGEADLFLSADLAQEHALPVMAVLWDFSGDVQLVYVQPDGAEQTLWDSREQEGAEPPKSWQNPWDYLLPQNVAAEDLLTLDLTVNWLPGSGRLEWRTQEGAEFHINILLENYSGLADNDLSM